jgi:hypothetical protein
MNHTIIGLLEIVSLALFASTMIVVVGMAAGVL